MRMSKTRAGGAAALTGGELRVHVVRVNVPPAIDLPVAEGKEFQQRERLFALLVAPGHLHTIPIHPER
jgi:hypothetical protein